MREGEGQGREREGGAMKEGEGGAMKEGEITHITSHFYLYIKSKPAHGVWI